MQFLKRLSIKQFKINPPATEQKSKIVMVLSLQFILNVWQNLHFKRYDSIDDWEQEKSKDKLNSKPLKLSL